MASARPILIWSIVAMVCLLVAWLAAGRRIALLLDRFAIVRLAKLPTSPLEYDLSSLRIGDVPLTLAGTDYRPMDLSVQSDPLGRLVLTRGGRSFTLGPRLTPPDPRGVPDVAFSAENGDEISFTSERSFLSQPTPFEINFMGGLTSSWRRYFYYRLIWKKPSGAKLEMLWRFEQRYYPGTGWSDGLMMYDFGTGLVRVKISTEPIEQEGVAVEYIARTKHWKRTDYRVESRGLSPDGRSDVLAVIHLEDLYRPSPGGGQSVELHVDRATHQVTRELGGQ
jgi:hypothetical protein